MDERTVALRMKDEGMTFREIGEALAVSTGQAHNLVSAARKQCRRAVELIPRGPSAERPAGEERAMELLRRLENDFTTLEDHALVHLEPAQLRGYRAAFDDAAARLDTLMGRRGGRKPGLAPALRDATIAFHGVLAATAGSCEEFARHIGTWRNADSFAADALALARMTSPRARVEIPAWEDDATLEPIGDRKPRLDRAARTERDMKIFLASVQGERQRDIAVRFGLSDRQVRNVLEAWRMKSPLPERDLVRLRRALAQRVPDLDGRLRTAPSPSLARARKDIALLIRALGSAKGGGADDSRPVVVGPAGLDIESIRALNGSIRDAMEGARVSDQLIEEVTGLVVEYACSAPDEETFNA